MKFFKDNKTQLIANLLSFFLILFNYSYVALAKYSFVVPDFVPILIFIAATNSYINIRFIYVIIIFDDIIASNSMMLASAMNYLLYFILKLQKRFFVNKPFFHFLASFIVFLLFYNVIKCSIYFISYSQVLDLYSIFIKMIFSILVYVIFVYIFDQVHITTNISKQQIL